MKVTDPVTLIEAAYRLDRTDASWLKELARAAAIALGGGVDRSRSGERNRRRGARVLST